MKDKKPSDASKIISDKARKTKINRRKMAKMANKKKRSTMIKVYCNPIVSDIQIPIAKLEGDKLFLVRVPIQMMLIGGDESAMFKEVEGFQEVSPEEFIRLAKKYASKESFKNFQNEFKKAYS